LINSKGNTRIIPLPAVGFAALEASKTKPGELAFPEFPISYTNPPTSGPFGAGFFLLSDQRGHDAMASGDWPADMAWCEPE
jgi:hypothetical protein